jgi:hypothetical protein
MTCCDRAEKCVFTNRVEADIVRSLALKGFATVYCRGDKQAECIRKKISKTLGGPEKVPENMMPNGLPLPGTSRKDWSSAVMALL